MIPLDIIVPLPAWHQCMLDNNLLGGVHKIDAELDRHMFITYPLDRSY